MERLKAFTIDSTRVKKQACIYEESRQYRLHSRPWLTDLDGTHEQDARHLSVDSITDDRQNKMIYPKVPDADKTQFQKQHIPTSQDCDGPSWADYLRTFGTTQQVIRPVTIKTLIFVTHVDFGLLPLKRECVNYLGI